MFCKKPVILLFFMSFAVMAQAQHMGSRSFAQLEIPFSSRFAGLGGVNLAIKDRDVSTALANPSLLDTIHHNKAVLGYSNYFADMNFGVAGYARSFNNIGNFMAAIKYFNYGKFTETDYVGNELGTVTAADYSLNLMYSKPVDTSVYLGANLNFLYSVMDKNTAFGVAVDVAATYQKPGSRFIATAMIRNVGYQVKSYTSGNRAPLPFDIQAAFSYKLKHAPFRFHFAFDRLTRWDLTYVDPTDKPEIDPSTGEEVVKDTSSFFYRSGRFFDKAMRHITPGAEILIGKNFYFDIAFHYRRREELKYTGKTGLAGFNFGAGLFVKRMTMALSLSKYHLAGTNVQMTFAYAF